MFPKASDLAPRRLVNAANLLTTIEGKTADRLRRYVCSNNLRAGGSSGVFDQEKTDALPQAKRQGIQDILDRLSPAQLHPLLSTLTNTLATQCVNSQMGCYLRQPQVSTQVVSSISAYLTLNLP